MLTFTFHYKDGRQVMLNDSLSYDHLDRVGLAGCEVKNGESTILFVHFDDDARKIPIYRRRVEMQQGGAYQTAAYILGWRGHGCGECINCIYDLPTGIAIEQSSKFLENHSWMYSVNLREFEKTEQEQEVSKQPDA